MSSTVPAPQPISETLPLSITDVSARPPTADRASEKFSEEEEAFRFAVGCSRLTGRTWEGGIRLLRPSSRGQQPSFKFTTLSCRAGVACVTWLSHDILISGGDSYFTTVWDVSERPPGLLGHLPSGPVHTVAASPFSRRHLLTGSQFRGQWIHLWDLQRPDITRPETAFPTRSGAVVSELRWQQHRNAEVSNNVFAASYTHTGRGRDGVLLWDRRQPAIPCARLSRATSFPGAAGMAGVDWSVSGKGLDWSPSSPHRLGFGTRTGKVVLWDVRQEGSLLQEISVAEDRIHAFRFRPSPPGGKDVFAVASADRTVRTVQLQEDGREEEESELQRVEYRFSDTATAVDWSRGEGGEEEILAGSMSGELVSLPFFQKKGRKEEMEE